MGSSFGGARRNGKVLQACHVCLDASLPDVAGVKGHVLTCSPINTICNATMAWFANTMQDQTGKINTPEQA